MDKKERRTYFLPVSFTIELTENSCLLKSSSMGLHFFGRHGIIGCIKSVVGRSLKRREFCHRRCVHMCVWMIILPNNGDETQELTTLYRKCESV